MRKIEYKPKDLSNCLIRQLIVNAVIITCSNINFFYHVEYVKNAGKRQIFWTGVSLIKSLEIFENVRYFELHEDDWCSKLRLEYEYRIQIFSSQYITVLLICRRTETNVPVFLLHWIDISDSPSPRTGTPLKSQPL